jgi:hypothetical protein
MSDCPVTGGQHVFVPVDTSTDEGRVTEVSRCGCGATQTITGPGPSPADDLMTRTGKLLIELYGNLDPHAIAEAATVFDPPRWRW